jgi:hypothetical protein
MVSSFKTRNFPNCTRSGLNNAKEKEKIGFKPTEISYSSGIGFE